MNLMMNKIITSILLIFSLSVQSQELLDSLQFNAALKKYSLLNQNYTTQRVSAINSELPFYEDFSNQGLYPDTAKWENSNSVYVNQTLAIAPPSLGIATFDGLKSNGYPYNIFSTSGSYFTDTLMSKKIRLDSITSLFYQLTPADSVYLSFYYQPEGVGDAPEPSDQLILDFKDNTGAWVQQWFKAGSNPLPTDSTFYRVMIKITNINYFHKNFQFRFRNKSTASGAVDMWHLDEVYLDRNRSKTDTLSRDVSFIYPSKSFLSGYSAIPYRQYPGASAMASNFNLTIRNSFNTAENITTRFDIYDNTNTPVYGLTTGSNNINPYIPNGYMNSPSMTYPSIAPFVYNNGNQLNDSITYLIKHHIITSGFDKSKRNDTLYYHQHFNNWFSYDDGSAEKAYGVNTYGGQIALKFDFIKADTLRAVDINFNPTVYIPTILNSSFRIKIWDNAFGVPTNVIYKDSLQYPIYSQSVVNGFARYQLTSPLLVNPGIYYVGLEQTLNNNLGIGMDMNTNNQSKLFYEVGNGWQGSSIKGSLMLRPILGDSIRALGIPKSTVKNVNENLIVYPNPNKGSFNVQLKNNEAIKEVKIYDLRGSNVYTEFIQSNEIQIQTNNLNAGLYFVYVVTENQKVYHTKIIIQP